MGQIATLNVQDLLLAANAQFVEHLWRWVTSNFHNHLSLLSTVMIWSDGTTSIWGKRCATMIWDGKKGWHDVRRPDLVPWHLQCWIATYIDWPPFSCSVGICFCNVCTVLDCHLYKQMYVPSQLCSVQLLLCWTYTHTVLWGSIASCPSLVGLHFYGCCLKLVHFISLLANWSGNETHGRLWVGQFVLECVWLAVLP